MGSEGSSGRSKVARLIEEYELDGVGTDLEAAWLGEGRERTSLRDLADEFNRALVVAAVRDAGMDVVEGEPANFYRLLTDDDVSAGQRVEARNRLERAGVDVDALEDDFVTYQAVRTFLVENRNAEYDGPRGDADVGTSIQRLQGRLVAVTESKLEQLQGNGDLAIGTFRTTVDVRVFCEDCSLQYTVGRLLERGGCDCELSETS
jgi:hypothetical protein